MKRKGIKLGLLPLTVAIAAGFLSAQGNFVARALSVSNITPDQSLITGGDTVTITGTDFPVDSNRIQTETITHNMHRGASQAYNGKIYMLSTYSNNELEIYDIATGNTVVKTLPNTMFRPVAQIYNGKLYMPEGNGTRLEIYDIANDTTTVKTLANAIYAGDMFIYSDQLYIVEYGGTTLEIYDIATDSSVTKVLLDTNHRTTQIYNGKLYLPQEYGNNIEIYDIATDTSEIKIGVHGGYGEYPTTHIYDSKLYLVSFLSYLHIVIYDIATNTGVVKTMPGPPSIEHIRTSQLFDGKIYMPISDKDKLVVYDIANDIFQTITLPSVTSDKYTSQFYDGRIYMPEGDGNNTMIIYDAREMSVTFGGVPATNVTVLNATTLTATVPPHAPGIVDVIVSDGANPITLSGAYRYIDPNAPVSPPVVPGVPNTGFRR
jgi:hypothetical protein